MMRIVMQVMHQRRRTEARAFCCYCHLVAAPPDIEMKGRT